MGKVVLSEQNTFWDSKARTRAKALVARLKDELHRQQFAIAIQACVGGKILGTVPYITKLFQNFFLPSVFLCGGVG
jgi:translation elongation factor EF-4